MGAVSTAFVNKFKDNIIQLVQQKGTKLRPSVMVDTDFNSEFKYYDQLGKTNMVQRVSRHQATPDIDPDHKRRRLAKIDWVHNVLFDTQDQLRMIVDPKSAYATSASWSAGRKMDDRIINAYNSTAYAGKAGGTATSFDANFQIAHGGAGLTKAKLLEAKELLDNQDVEDEDRYCVCTPAQITDLLNLSEVTSSDYNSVKALVQGEIDSWLGFKFIRISSQRLGTDGTSRLIYCYHKAAIQLGISREPTVRIDQRPDLMYAWQVYLEMTIGATRLEEERIVQIACNE